MKIPTLLLSPDLSRDRAGVVTPTQTGAVRTVQGQYGTSWFVEEGTTNYLHNPRGESSLSGWYVGGWIGIQDKTVTVNSIPSAKFVCPSTAPPLTVAVSTITTGEFVAGNPVSFSCKLRSSREGASYRIRAYEDSGVGYLTTLDTTITPTTNGWTDVTLSLAALPTGVGAGRLRFYVYNDAKTQAGDTLWVAATQQEKKAYSTSYADGSLGTGYSWTGTAHASTSVRPVMTLRTIAKDHGVSSIQGSMLVRVRWPDINNFTGASIIARFGEYSALAGSNDYISLHRSPLDKLEVNTRTNAVTSSSIRPTLTLQNNTDYVIYVEWTKTTVSMSVNNAPLQTVARTVLPTGILGPNEFLNVGGLYLGGGQNHNGHMSPIILFKEPLTQVERESIANMQQPWTWENLMPRMGGTIRTDYHYEYNRTEGVGAYPTLLLKPDASRDRAGVVTPTTSGALRTADSSVTETKTITPLMLARPNASQDAAGSLTPAVTSTVTTPTAKYASGWQLAKAKTAPPLSMLSPSESRDTLGTITPTITGAVRTVAGQQGNAWFIEEGVTNQLPNPAPNAAWYVSNTNTIKEVIADTSVPSGRTMTITANDTAAHVSVPAEISYTTNAVHTASVYLWSANPSQWTSVSIRLFYRYTDGTATATSTVPVTLTTTPTRYSQTVTADTAKTVSHIAFYIYATPAIVGAILRLSSAQIEQRAYTTSYADGSLGTGYSWTGTAHGSSSTRVVGSVAPPDVGTRYLSPIQGSIIFAFRRDTMAAAQGSPRVWNLGGYGNTGDHLAVTLNSVGHLAMSSTANGAINLTTGTGSITGHLGSTWYIGYCEWSPTHMRLVTSLGDVTRVRTAPVGTVNADNVLRIGRDMGSQLFNGYLSPVLTFPRPLQEYERSYLFATNPWNWNELNLPDATVNVGYEATTNLVLNPVAANDLTNILPVRATLTRDTTRLIKGNNTIKVVVNNVSSGNQGINFTTAEQQANTLYTCQVSIYHELGSDRKFFLGNQLIQGETVSVPHGVSTTITYTQSRSANASYMEVRLSGMAAINETFWVTRGQIEQKSYATSYADGSLGTDHAWTGTAHASTSTRVARGGIEKTKSYLVRYREGSTDKTAFLRGSRMLGTTGYASFDNGSLSLSALTSTPIIVESVATYDKDMTSVQAALLASNAVWTWQNLTTDVVLPKPAWFIEEGTTNLVTNPRVHGNANLWATFTDAVRSHLTTDVGLIVDGVNITSAVRYTFTAPRASGLNGPTITVPAANATRSASLYVRAGNSQAVGKRFILGVYNAAFLGTTVHFLTADWQRVTVSFPMTTAHTSAIILPSISNSVAGDVLDMTALQFEDKAYTTTYTDGALGTGYTWSGTPHASTSTRAATYPRTVVTNHLSSNKGSVFVRFKNQSPFGSGNRYLFGSGNYGSTDFLALIFGDNIPKLWARVGTDPHMILSSGVTVPVGVLTSAYAEWDGTSLGLSVNNGTKVTGIRPIPSGSNDTVLSFGSDVSGNQQTNANIERMIFFDRPLSDQERTYLNSLSDWEWEQFERRVGTATHQGVGTPLLLNRAEMQNPLQLTRVINTEPSITMTRESAQQPLVITRQAGV